MKTHINKTLWTKRIVLGTSARKQVADKIGSKNHIRLIEIFADGTRRFWFNFSNGASFIEK